MGIEETDKKGEKDVDVEDDGPSAVGRGVPGEGEKLVVRVGQDGAEGGGAPIGTSRYVFAAYFAVGLSLAFVLGQAVTTGWGKLAGSQSVVDYVPWISLATEDVRETWGHVAGGVIALAALVYSYRRKDVRGWVNDAAGELAKVTWPTKDEVMHGTVVVVVAAFIATVYLTLLDRFWGYVTDWVYRT